MTETEAANLATARRYLDAIGGAAGTEEIATFFTEDVVQEEFPNRVTPNGARRDLASIREASERGRAVMRSQRFDVLGEVANGAIVALEVRWTGILAVPFGTLRPGDAMTGRMAMFLEFRDGRIALQRNYDCFDPWG